MQKHLAIDRGVKILDQIKSGGGGSTTPPPASLRVKETLTLITLFQLYFIYYIAKSCDKFHLG